MPRIVSDCQILIGDSAPPNFKVFLTEVHASDLPWLLPLWLQGLAALPDWMLLNGVEEVVS